MAEIPILLLAAGGSSRMGQPKQLLNWGKTTLIEYQISKLLEPGNPVIVVLGSSSEKITPIIEKYPVSIVINENWEKGMGTSVSCGMNYVEANFPSANAVLFALIDQPMVTEEHFRNLIKSFTPEKKQIIVSKSKTGWLGVPAIFDISYFGELSQLSGEQGAKTLIIKYLSNVISVEGGEILEDMDTPEKYRQLLEKQANNRSC